MRKMLIVLAPLFFAVPALAQSPSGAESRASFQAFVAAEFPDNTSGFVTPMDLRTGLLALSNSALFSFSQLADLPTGPSTLPSGYTYPSAIVTTSLTLPYTAGAGTQCLQINNAGVVEPTGTGCGGSSTGLVVGTSPVVGGTPNGLFYDNAGVLGNTNAANNGVLVTSGAGAPSISTTLPSALTIPAPVVTGSFTATGLVTNADLVSPTISINSTNCTLGSSCTITASTSSMTVGTTAVLSGSNNYILYNNGGTLGNIGTTGSFGLVALSQAPSIDSPTFTTSVTATGLITLADLATQGTNTVLVNATAGSSSPTAQSVSGCSAAGDALIWTTNTGFGCNTSITAAAVPASGITGTTLPAGIVTSSITTVGTIGTGVWAGTSVALNHGGTNNAITADNGGIIYSDASKLVLLASTGTASQCLLSGNHAAPTWGSCSGAAAVSSVSDSGSGTLTISPTTGAVVAALNLGNANTWTAAQTFTNSDLILKGSSTGTTTLTSANSSGTSYTLTVPAITDTVATNTEVIRAAGGRMTLTSGTPVMTASATAQSTLYYSTYAGNSVPFYNGSVDAMGAITSNQMSDAMAASGTGVLNANGIFDVWYFYNSGTPKICIATNGSGGGWASDTGGSNTARGTGYSQLDMTTRSYPTNANSITHCYNAATDYGSISANQATYLGTILTDAASAGSVSYTFGSAASGGGASRFGVWNYYNRVSAPTSVADNGAAYTYSGVQRAARGSTANRITFVSGVAEDAISSSYFGTADTVATAGAYAAWQISLDSTSTFVTYGQIVAATANVFNGIGTPSATFAPQVGLHFIQATESSDNVHANLFDVASTNVLQAIIRN